MVLTLFKCIQQVTGTGKAEGNYEEEKKSAEYRQAEHLMKVIIGGERLQLVQSLVLQINNVILGCWLIEFDDFLPQNWDFSSSLSLQK